MAVRRDSRLTPVVFHVVSKPGDADVQWRVVGATDFPQLSQRFAVVDPLLERSPIVGRQILQIGAGSAPAVRS